MKPPDAVTLKAIIRDSAETARSSVDKILDAATVAPEVVNQLLADIPDDKWRNMIETLRHPA